MRITPSSLNCVALAVLLVCAGASYAGLDWFKTTRNWTDTFAEIDRRFEGVTNVSTDYVATQLQAPQQANPQSPKPILLDVREPAEFEVSHLQGAVQVSNLEAALGALHGVRPDQQIIVYCSVGWRSSALAQSLSKNGFKRVSNMRGGIFTWANEGRELRARAGTVDLVHPFNADWGQLLSERKRAKLLDSPK
jgi:rhodanese-related sulfurtransferase